MKNLIKLLSLMLAVVMVLGMVACGENPSDSEESKDAGKTYTDPYASIEDYDEKSQALYDAVLGEFYTAYEAAKK